jgi:glycosyltransferase involved in cell wall biosynthesis
MDFVSFSLNYWGDLWQSRHQIMRELSKTHRVLFVSPAFTLSEVFQNLKGKTLPASGINHLEENFYTLVFPKLLFRAPGRRQLDRFMGHLQKLYVARKMKKLGFRDVVVFIWHPTYVELVGQFKSVLTCYYADDEFADYAGLKESDRQQIVEQEEILLRQSDVVFANGPVLLEKKNRYGNAISVPMTADFALYSKSRLAETSVPDDLKVIPHPRIGYIGNINDKVDLALLNRLATARPNWSFVLVGPIGVRTPDRRTEIQSLQQLKNVFLLGLKKRELLPNYIKGLDVCTMWYQRDGWASAVYPLKLHEYLASGKPVVGSALRSLQDFAHVIRIADTPEEWLESLEDALNDHDQSLAQMRVDVAYENRLEQRIRLIEEALLKNLEQKRASR